MADQPANLDAFFLNPSTPAPVAAPPPAPVVQQPPAAPPPPAQAPPPPAYQPQFASAPPGVVIPPAYQPIETPTPAAPPPVVMPPVAAPPPATVVPETPQPTQQQVSDALQAAKELGIDVGRFKDGADLVNTMWATVQEMNREIEQQRAQYQQMLAQHGMQAPTSQQTPPAAPDGFKWDMPQYDPAWDQYPDDPAMQAAKRQYMLARNKTADRMLSQFPELVKQVVAPELEQAREAIRQQMQQEIAKYRYDQQVEALESRLTPHLYTMDLRGQRTLTPWGQRIIQTVEAYREQGVQDPLWIMQQAEALVGPPPGNGQPPAAPPAQLPVAAASPQVVAQPPGAPTAGLQQPQAGGFIPGTNYRVMPVTTMQIRAPDGTIVSPNQLSEQQKASFLQQAQAARATHVPQVGTTPADIQSRPVTEADLNTWFLQPTQG